MPTRSLIAALTVIAGLALGGCAAQEQIKQARQARKLNDPVDAAQHFEAALRLKPSLADDQDLMAEVLTARRNAAVTLGNSLLDQRQWLKAIERFEAALAIEPGYAPAAQGLSQAQAGAAAMYYAQAIDHADADQLEDARAALTSALAQQPGHADAARAMALLDDPAAAGATAAALYEQAVQAMATQHWPQAEQALTHAIAAQANLLPARARLHRVRQTVAKAQTLFDRGRSLHADKQLDQALAALTQAHDLSPHDAGIAAALDQAQRDRAQVDRLTAAGEQALQADRWDDAIASAAAALEIFPGEARATQVVEHARDAAAAHHAQAGAAHVAAGELDQAEASLRQALRYRPRHAEARQSYAQLATIRGDAAAEQGRWGAALLQYMAAQNFHPTAEGAESVGEARAGIVQRAGVGIELRRPQAAAPTGDAALFEARLIRRLAAKAPAMVALRREPATGPSDIRYGFAVAVVDASAGQKLASSQPRTFSYYEDRLAPNPEIDRIERRLDWAHDAVDRAAREVSRRRRRARDALRRSQEAPADESRRRDARRQADRLDDALDDLRRQRREARHIELDLRRTPRLVTVVVRMQWPYQIETYRKIGQLVARVTLHDPALNQALSPITVESSFSDSDTTIRGGNARIGMQPDPLQLPSDAEALSAMIDDAVAKAAARVIQRVVEAEVSHIRAAAEKFAAQGDAAAQLEAQVDAALLLPAADQRAGQRALDALRKQ